MECVANYEIKTEYSVVADGLGSVQNSVSFL